MADLKRPGVRRAVQVTPETLDAWIANMRAEIAYHFAQVSDGLRRDYVELRLELLGAHNLLRRLEAHLAPVARAKKPSRRLVAAKKRVGKKRSA